MAPDDARKRKACQSCIRAKAKCSPFEGRHDLCYRCQRLNKECIYEEKILKRGPKTRSRVKQLEQRVDTLIDLLAANGQSTKVAQPSEGVPLLPTINTAVAVAEPSAGNSVKCSFQPPYATPVETPDGSEAGAQPFEPYDPVEAGVINEEIAANCLEEFKDSFVSIFPFVVIPVSTDAKRLRQQQPFLFLAIMAATTYRSPQAQRALAEELKKQMASRIIGHSHKSLEILQGLLVYGAWYHYFYHPENQQMAIIIQLCVAMIQDLGLSRNHRDKVRKMTVDEICGPTLKPERSSAEKRALLGAYYLSVLFAQAWRKRSTMNYTRYMAQCCRSLAEGKEYASDEVITPIIHSSELMSRVSDYFSYDDIENADVKGEVMLGMSIANFRSEAERIRNATPASLKANKAFLNLIFCLLDIWIHEGSLHSPLWNTSTRSNACIMTPTRVKSLNCCINAMKSFLKALVAIPDASLQHLAFPAWTGWFYAITVACKLVFLEENERDAQTDLESTDREISRLILDEDNEVPTNETCALPAEVNVTAAWDPIAVAKEAEVQLLFDLLVKKLAFAIPDDPAAWTRKKVLCNPLFHIVYLQRSLLHGFTKRLKKHVSQESGTTDTSDATTSDQNMLVSTQTHQPTHSQYDPTATQQAQYLRHRIRDHPIPLMDQLNFNSLNFDSIALQDPISIPQNAYDDWLWDTVMDDFAMPGL